MGRITSQPNFYVGQKFQILVGYFILWVGSNFASFFF